MAADHCETVPATERRQPPGIIRAQIVQPMLDLLDRLVDEAHRKDPHPYGHHNHHLCIQVQEWHTLLDEEATDGR